MSDKKMGRPQIKIDQKQFETLCSILCTQDEIIGVLDIGKETLSRWCKRTYKMTFEDIYKNKSALGKMSLRRHQFELAQKGNATMLIWLGKQLLGQHDKLVTENTTSLNAKVESIDPTTLKAIVKELEDEV